MMRVLLLREATRAAQTAAMLRAQGLTPLLLPLETVEPLSPPVPGGVFDGLVATSAHALPWLLRHCPPDARPLFTVGSATADAARRIGYADVMAAGGTAVSLASLLMQSASGRRILYAAGLPRRPDLESALALAGMDVTTVDVYRTGRRQPLPGEVEALLDGTPPDCVMLLSAAQAEAYGALQARLGGTMGTGPLFCLSARIVAALPPSLRHNCVVSAVPALDSLIEAMLRHRCTLP